MLLKGWDGHKASIVIAYQPCQAKDTKVGMVYQQHHWQQLEEGLPLTLNPHSKFHHDLVWQLWAWQHDNEQIILFMDANENTTHGPLNADITGPGLLMWEAVQSLHPDLPATPTYTAGSCTGCFPIDCVYIMPDLPIEAGTWVSV